MICSSTGHISGEDFQPVLKSPGEPQTEGEALASQGISSVGVSVLCFNTFLLDAPHGVVCVVSQN